MALQVILQAHHHHKVIAVGMAALMARNQVAVAVVVLVVREVMR
jgi:hypothetical protein